MLRFACVLALVPGLVWAEEVIVETRVTHATLYVVGAEVTRTAQVTLPAGRHQLILTDVPLSAVLGSMQFSADGLELDTLTERSEATPPRESLLSPALVAAEAEVERLTRALELGEDDVARLRLQAEAAEVQLGVLRKIVPEGVPQDPASVAALIETVGAVSLKALEAAQAAKIAARDADAALEPLRRDLAEAEQARDALRSEDEDRYHLTLDVTAEAAFEG